MKILNCPECGLTLTDAQSECPRCHTKIDNDLTAGEQGSERGPKSVKEEMIQAVIEAEAEELTEQIDDVQKTEEELIAAAVEAEALAAMEEEAAENLCETCLSPVEEGQNFCHLCGSTVEAAETVQAPALPKTDEEANKWVAVIGYIFFFFPAIVGYYNKSKFSKFHAKQAFALLLSSIVLFMILVIFKDILDGLFRTIVPLGGPFGTVSELSWHHGTGVIFHYYLIGMINLVHLMPFVLMIIGMINAIQGKKKPLPIVGKFVKAETES
ncbi:MAG: hypothetical protein FWE07_04985 [Turicibacter sp.]|nr:hypothetical protein [Turicibacter sp.]